MLGSRRVRNPRYWTGAEGMRIAVVDHVGNRGGGSRFLRALLPALASSSESCELTFFGDAQSMAREGVREDLGRFGIDAVPLRATWTGSGRLFNSPIAQRAIPLIRNRIFGRYQALPSILTGDVSKELEKKVRGYDAAFFPWPYLISIPKLDCPIIATIHDLNFKYYFSGQPTYTPGQATILEETIPGWLLGASIVVSTKFMHDEILKFYPWFRNPLSIVPLSNLSRDAISYDDARMIVEQLGLRKPYILFPTHTCSHKNAGPLVAAVALMRESGRSTTLVMTGEGTQRLGGRSSQIGVEVGTSPQDVVGLGYVPNDAMNALIRCASIVVNPSLYEGGNGSGLDAWAAGVPVAMSNIPPFTEHLTRLGVSASVFNPRDPREIARSLCDILDNPESEAVRARASSEAMARFTWAETAVGYSEVFKAAIRRNES